MTMPKKLFVIVINVLLKYNWCPNFMDNETAIDPRLQSIKKYKKYIAHIADKYNHHQYFLSTLAVFVNEAYIDYDKRLRFG